MPSLHYLFSGKRQRARGRWCVAHDWSPRGAAIRQGEERGREDLVLVGEGVVYTGVEGRFLYPVSPRIFAVAELGEGVRVCLARSLGGKESCRRGFCSDDTWEEGRGGWTPLTRVFRRRSSLGNSRECE